MSLGRTARFYPLNRPGAKAVGRALPPPVEFGTIGTDFAHVPEGGFARTDASVQVGLRPLRGRQLRALERMIPPEWTFHQVLQTFRGITWVPGAPSTDARGQASPATRAVLELSRKSSGFP